MTPPILSPPALHFLIIAFTITCGDNQLIFAASTDVPCHLYLHLSHEEPIIRRIPYQKRGADFELSSVTCFVEVDTIDQDESGDTTTHTFTVPLVAYNHMHYWYLTGTQGGTPMISISQIFKAQCPLYVPPPVTVKIYSGYGWHKPGIDAWLNRFYTNATWANIHDGAGTFCDCGYTNIPAFWACSTSSGRFANLYRGKITHDLSSIPVGSTILSISYHFVLYWKGRYYAIPISLALFDLPGVSYTTCAPSDYQKCAATPISNVFQYGDLTVGQWAQFDILPAYFSLFPPGGKSAISLREATYDAPNINPGCVYLKQYGFRIRSIEYTGSASDPYLEITYQPP